MVPMRLQETCGAQRTGPESGDGNLVHRKSLVGHTRSGMGCLFVAQDPVGSKQGFLASAHLSMILECHSLSLSFVSNKMRS